MSLSGRQILQNERELAEFIGILKDHNVRSFLEIGSRYGDTLYEIGKALKVPSRVVSLDLPLIKKGMPDPQPFMANCCDALRKIGHSVEMIWANSRDERTIAQVAEAGPYDAIFIDGDHSYEGVKADWLNYGGMGKIVGFHDITPIQRPAHKNPIEVPRLWREICAERLDAYQIVHQPVGYGIGIVFNG